MSLQDIDGFHEELECQSVSVGPLLFIVPVDIADTYGEDFVIEFDERTRLPRVRAAKGPIAMP